MASKPLSAFVWWLIPAFSLMGSLIYVLWVSKYQRRYENETSRSVNKFQRFQNSFISSDGAPSDVKGAPGGEVKKEIQG